MTVKARRRPRPSHPRRSPRPRSRRRPRCARRAPPPPDAPPPPPPQAETPADFSGTTLTNDGPGARLGVRRRQRRNDDGPIGRPGAKVTGRRAGRRDRTRAAKAAPIVALASLSRPPAPPNLNDALERHYPKPRASRARRGQAVRRRASPPRARSATGAGVAERARVRRRVPRSCGNRYWSPPLDRDGQAVSTSSATPAASRFDDRTGGLG